MKKLFGRLSVKIKEFFRDCLKLIIVFSIVPAIFLILFGVRYGYASFVRTIPFTYVGSVSAVEFTENQCRFGVMEYSRLEHSTYNNVFTSYALSMETPDEYKNVDENMIYIAVYGGEINRITYQKLNYSIEYCLHDSMFAAPYLPKLALETTQEPVINIYCFDNTRYKVSWVLF